MRRALVFILFIAVNCVSYAQSPKTVFYHLDKITVKKNYSLDSLKREKDKAEALTTFRLNGYLGVTLKDSAVKKNALHYYYSASHQFKKIELIRKGEKKDKTTLTKNITKAITALNDEITDLENSGFPFACIKIDEQTEHKNKLTLNYHIDSGDYFIIDKINIKSKNEFHEKTVLNILGIRAGDPYNEEKIRAINTILENNEMYSVPRAPELLFRAEKAELFVYIEKKKSSNADGYVGFQQDRITEKLVLNGYINLELKNALNRAEVIHLNWRNNPDQTQDLKTIFEFPYLFGSPIGIGANIDLQKQDTSFIRSDLLFELIYRNPQFRVSIFDQIEQSSILQGEPIPGFRDYSKNTVGVAITYRPFMPERLHFYHPEFNVSAGIFNYREDTLDDNTRKIGNNKYRFGYGHTIDLWKYFHLNNDLSFQGLSSTVGLSRNEFIYFGGLQSVRGFYELELAGKEIWILRNEFEFQPISSLSMKILYDYANFVGTDKNYSHSVGFGFGLINNASQLEIIVANGKLNDNPFTLSDTKIHIGFKSSF